MPVIIILAPQFWHLGRLSMIFSGLGINWGWGMGSSCFRRGVTGLSATDAWHRAEPVVRYVQHLFLEGLVKMDHFQKEPPLNLKGTTGAQGTDGNPARSECPLWVKSGHVRRTSRCPLSANSGHWPSSLDYLVGAGEQGRRHC